MTRIAIIDMGTNTFHLLVATVGPEGSRILYRNHEAVKIGKAGINDGIIIEGAYQRAITAMKKFRKIIDEHGVSQMFAFGTSALRNAENGQSLAKEIEALTGIPIRIISGDEEADLIFEGIKAALDPGDENSLVMDIGAGSVEFIIGSGKQVCWKQSFEIGGQRLLEKFHNHDPITPVEIAALDAYFQEKLDPLFIALKKFPPKQLIGSSGTFDTLSDIFCLRQGIRQEPDASETPLSLEGFYEIYHELIRKDREERMKIGGMIEMRVDMIVVACCLIRFVLENHTFEGIRVSTYALKEGALAILSRQFNAPGT